MRLARTNWDAPAGAVRNTVSTVAHYVGTACHPVASTAEKVCSFGKGVVTAMVT